jgi:hypothetical protein
MNGMCGQLPGIFVSHEKHIPRGCALSFRAVSARYSNMGYVNLVDDRNRARDLGRVQPRNATCVLMFPYIGFLVANIFLKRLWHVVP